MRAITAIARSGASGAALGLLAWPVAAELAITLDGEGSLLLARPCASLSQAKNMPDPIALLYAALGCVTEDRPDDAARLVLLMEAWLHDDARRFGSREPRSTLQEAGLEFDRALPEGRRSAAKAALQRNRTGDDFSTWCRDAGAFPSPKNDPDDLKRDGEMPKRTPLQNFDPAALWRDTLVEEMHCPS